MKPNILFMGTPEFAVPSLEILVASGYPVIGVVTQPDRPKGRGMRLAPPPVKVFAETQRLAVFQPERLRTPEFLQIIHELAPDLIAVSAFGQILPVEMIERPRFGCINVHPSLLPKYRGAAPLNWAIIQGETVTGITIMQMDAGMDSGDILLQEETAIGPNENVGELHDRLARRGAQLLAEAIERMLTGAITRTPQDPASATFAPRLKKHDGLIRWEADAEAVVRLVRGLSPSPGAYTFFGGKVLRVYSAAVRDALSGLLPGAVWVSENELRVNTGTGSVSLLDLQLEGRKRMPAREFLRGCRLQPGDRFG